MPADVAGIFAILRRSLSLTAPGLMIIRLFRARHALPACLILLCAACGGTPPAQPPHAAEPATAGNYYLGTRPVYAALVAERGGSWIFTNLTASDDTPDSGYLVRLNDLTPAFDTRKAECVPQVYPEAHRCSPIHPFRDKDTGVFDKIINGSIAVGTAGKVTEISQTYETTFDEVAFNRAVDEALLNTGLDVDRHQLITLIEAYDMEFANAQAELAELAQRLATNNDGGARVEFAIEPAVSGLTEYYSGDIEFAELVEIAVADAAAVPAADLDRQDILPCDARQCAARAESALATLQRDVRAHKARLSAALQPEAQVYAVRCDEAVYGDYLLQAQCPDRIVVANGQPARLPVAVTILSRDFENLYPSFDLDDERLGIAIDGRSITFRNATDEYITLTAQTVYYNSQVHTSSVPIDIPPGIAVTRDMAEFVSRPIDIESSYRQMTPDKAAGASFRFGLAVRYRIASMQEEQTLHQSRSFNVGCAIRNRLDAGSCTPESLVDTRRPVPAAGGKPSSVM